VAFVKDAFVAVATTLAGAGAVGAAVDGAVDAGVDGVADGAASAPHAAKARTDRIASGRCMLIQTPPGRPRFPISPA
jgi:hypothetical protein